VRDYLDLRDWLARQQWDDMNDYADAKTGVILHGARREEPATDSRNPGMRVAVASRCASDTERAHC